MSRNKDLWFPFYWNDYTNDTLDLTQAQHGAYLCCMLAYYKVGGPLPSELPTVFRMVGAFTKDEQESVAFVLNRFFKKNVAGCYCQSRIDFEIQNTDGARRAAAENGRLGGSADSDAQRAYRNRGSKTIAGVSNPLSDNDSERDSKTITNRAEQNRTDSEPQQSNNRAEQEQSAATTKVPLQQPACLPTENGRPEGRSLKEQTSFSEAAPLKLRNQAKVEKEMWIAFVTDKKAGLPETMRHAQPTDEERRAVLAQLEATVVPEYLRQRGTTKAEYLGQSISDWEETQSPPLHTLQYGRWKRWLETGDPNS
ncbi:MAG TPA: DUF1376 domain-containing protein [Terriglobales bacterium]|nr:DUF1376 domain-containing protein [Terriglobales bacterium]